MVKRIIKRPSIYSKLRSLIKNDKDITIKFINYDGSRVTQHLSKKFMENKSVDQIVNDIFAIKNDKRYKTIIL